MPRVTNKTAICAQAPIAVFTMPMRGYAFVTFKLSNIALKNLSRFLY